VNKPTHPRDDAAQTPSQTATEGHMQQTCAAAPSGARRRFLQTSGGLLAAAGLGSMSLTARPVRAQGKGQVVVRGLGGAYQDAMDKALYKPFTAATGVDVVVQPATAAQIRAMVEAKRVAVDVVDLVDVAQLALDRIGALEPIAYDRMQYTNPSDIHAPVRKANMVGNLYFATVLVYNTDAFKNRPHPTSWAEFWDVAKFAGPRTLADQKSGAAELEFALLADGVTKDKLYPIDIARALRSLDRIKPEIVKWWDTGAISAQLLERKEAVLGGLWNGRAQDLIDKGAPLAIEWNQAKRQVQYWSVIKPSTTAGLARRGQRCTSPCWRPSWPCRTGARRPSASSRRHAAASMTFAMNWRSRSSTKSDSPPSWRASANWPASWTSTRTRPGRRASKHPKKWQPDAVFGPHRICGGASFVLSLPACEAAEIGRRGTRGRRIILQAHAR